VILGIHPWDLAAIALLDKTFSTGTSDANYLANRRNSLLVGIYPTQPWEYRFSNSMIGDEVDAIPVSDYLRVTNEYVNPQSTAKWTRFHRDSYAVGALARYNNNAGQLPEAVKSLARQLGLSVPCHNPFMNNAAQVMECLLSAQKIIEHLDWLLDKELSDEDGRFEVGEGRGVGAVEVPRGILFHDYTYDKTGSA